MTVNNVLLTNAINKAVFSLFERVVYFLYLELFFTQQMENSWLDLSNLQKKTKKKLTTVKPTLTDTFASGQPK